MLRALVLGAMAVLPAGAGGACPAEFGDGLVVAYGDGSVSRISAGMQAGLIREQVLHGGGEGFEVLAWHGIYVLRSIELDPQGEVEGTVESVTFAAPPPAPEPGQRFEGLTAEVGWMGLSFSRSHDMQAGDLSEMVVAGCTYPAYLAELTLTEPEQSMLMRFVVLPTLGTALLTALVDDHGAEVYQPLSIAPLAAGMASN